MKKQNHKENQTQEHATPIPKFVLQFRTDARFLDESSHQTDFEAIA